jgi:hypothetical protein
VDPGPLGDDEIPDLFALAAGAHDGLEADRVIVDPL